MRPEQVYQGLTCDIVIIIIIIIFANINNGGNYQLHADMLLQNLGPDFFFLIDLTVFETNLMP
jgi:hypothetical protein